MNKLPFEKQSTVLSMLVEGNSIRSTERVTGVHRDTIMRLLVSSGRDAETVLNARMRNLQSKFVQVDEIWCYVAKKRSGMDDSDKENILIGDQWTFIAMDADTKLVLAHVVGKRTMQNADRLMESIRDRITTRFQLSSDAFVGYRLAVPKFLGGEVDYGHVVKHFGNDKRQERRYSPAKIVTVTIRPVMGDPDISKISTSYIERQNLTLRMENRRFTRLTNGFSKKLENLQAAVALHFYHYNFMRIHSTLRCTPAMAAGVTDTVWTWLDLYQCGRTYKIAA